jgi:hypothetical protein
VEAIDSPLIAGRLRAAQANVLGPISLKMPKLKRSELAQLALAAGLLALLSATLVLLAMLVPRLHHF